MFSWLKPKVPQQIQSPSFLGELQGGADDNINISVGTVEASLVSLGNWRYSLIFKAGSTISAQFDVHSSLNIWNDNNPSGSPCLTWRALPLTIAQHPTDSRLQQCTTFRFTPTNSADLDIIIVTLARCLSETESHQSSQNLTNGELKMYFQQRCSTLFKPVKSAFAAMTNFEQQLNQTMSSALSTLPQTPPPPTIPNMPPESSLIHRIPITFYILDIQQNKFVEVEKTCFLELFKSTQMPFSYALRVSKVDGEALIWQSLTNEFVPEWRDAQNSLLWLCPVGQTILSLAVRFLTVEADVNKMKESLRRAMWEVRNRQPFEKCEDQDSITGAFSGMQIQVAPPPQADSEIDFAGYDEQYENKRLRASQIRRLRNKQQRMGVSTDNLEESSSESESESESDDPRSLRSGPAGKPAAAPKRTKTSKIRNVVLGAHNPRGFAMRDGEITVYNTDVDGTGQFGSLDLPTTGTLQVVNKFDASKGFRPTAGILHNGEQQMLLLNKENAGKVSLYDLNKGVVVDTFEVSKDTNTTLDTLALNRKLHYDDPTFIGMNMMGYHVLDTRINGGVGDNGTKAIGDENRQKMYAKSTDPRFTTVATTEAGQMALGSEKGVVRLYDATLSKIAKTQLQVCDGGIIGMDVSKDGKWIICTTPILLFLVNTEFSKGLGFDARMGQEKKESIELRLAIKDQMKMGGAVSFTPAKFDSSLTGQETLIVTTTGPYVVTWSLNGILSGKKTDYKIKRAPSTLVAGGFVSASRSAVKDIMVATEETLKVEKLTKK
ncbi:putative Vacuolar import and degradation protein 27 [Blattamonas nauphoetae]|uniref:Vacuolar import and degradation protein 27 n=1 Tax=Blattamonas nauphoetae TaxID=2049346 RepID=A0ABQ9XZH5_9EUKA|nr:putative Vacuolar import and degradation protein 27 [Blattamonas nauphoetae]